MPQDKNKSPFAGGASYEKILNVPADKIRERIRKSGSKDKDELLTSKDLFGDIIEDFSEEELEGEADSSSDEIVEAPKEEEVEPKAGEEPRVSEVYFRRLDLTLANVFVPRLQLPNHEGSAENIEIGPHGLVRKPH